MPVHSYEGQHGTVLCLACRFFGIGVEHPEWCSWQVLKERPVEYSRALAIVELGERVVQRLEHQLQPERLPVP